MGAGVLGFDPALLRAIAERVGTPVYVYGANLIRAQYHALEDALRAAGVRHRICYAVKANGNLGVLRVLKALGAGAGIVSGGELRRALAAGFDPAAVVFSGPGKTPAELEASLRAGVGLCNIESARELDAVAAAAHRVGKRPDIGIRVNPDVSADVHPASKSAEQAARFGVPFDEVVALARRAAAEPGVTLRGLAMHLGSQITEVEAFRRGTVKLLELAAAIRASGVTTLETLDMGGGVAARYGHEAAPAPQAFAEAVAPAVRAAGLALVLEPGRYLVANAGVLLTRVMDLKHAGGRDYVVVDAGVNDCAHSSRSLAHHAIVPLADGEHPAQVVRVVGRTAEPGEGLALDRRIPGVAPGELLALLGAGAYGFVLTSTFSARPRPPEVLVEAERYYVARQRETPDDLVRGETVEPTTWYRA